MVMMMMATLFKAVRGMSWKPRSLYSQLESTGAKFSPAKTAPR